MYILKKVNFLYAKQYYATNAVILLKYFHIRSVNTKLSVIAAELL